MISRGKNLLLVVGYFTSVALIGSTNCLAFQIRAPDTGSCTVRDEWRRRTWKCRRSVGRVSAVSDDWDGSLSPYGILSADAFHKLSRLDASLTTLQKQIPSILTTPLTEEQASNIFTVDTRLTVGQNSSIELASDRKELLSICNALLLFFAASNQAGQFLSSFTQSSPSSEASSAPEIKSEIVLLADSSNLTCEGAEPFCTELQVFWSVNTRSLGTMDEGKKNNSLPQVPTALKGISVLSLNSESQIATHTITDVSLNDVSTDPQAIGQYLATLRQTVKGLQDSPFLQTVKSSSPQATSLFSVFDQIRDEFVQQQISKAQSIKHRSLAPLFVSSSNTTNKTSLASEAHKKLWIPIENHTVSTVYPMPGSSKWVDFASSYNLIYAFVKRCIPSLAGQQEDVSIESLFSKKVRIVAVDGSILVDGRQSVVNFYSELATWRKRLSASWTLKNVSVANLDGLKNAIEVSVSYNTKISIPGTSSTYVQGKDTYTLSKHSSQDGTERKNHDVCIEKIQQTEFSVRENTSRLDNVILMRNVVRALETGGQLKLPTWLEGNISFEKDSVKARWTQRSDVAALTGYRVMESLQRDYVDLVKVASVNDPASMVPAGQMLEPTVRLKGYLGETLIGGDKQLYTHSIRLVISSFQTALRSKRLTSEKDPNVVVELTQEGNIKCSVTLYLKASPLLPSIGEISSPVGTSAAGATLPLKIELLSLYLLDPDSGRVMEHKLMESRVNGQLTPGDRVSRWILRLTGNQVEDGATDWIRTLQDTIDMVRSMNGKAN